jgi:DNA-binding SARP family transcriptional activator
MLVRAATRCSCRVYIRRVRFAVIGPLVVTSDLAPVTVPGAKERLLLAVLAASTPAVVSTDRLLETLWEGAPPPTARKSLQAHVVRLRSALEPDRPTGSTGRYVVRRGLGYALAVDRDAVDALAIGDLAARGRAQLASGDAEAAVRQLSAALEVWRGEPYADWPHAAFADGERRRLAEVRAGAEAGLLEAQIALGRHADVVPELERLVADEPLREGWWSLLMLALYRDGRQGEALAAGRRARALLAEELGADPGPGLRGVETAILAQDPALDLPAQRTGHGPTPRLTGSSDDTWAAPGSCPYKGLAAYQVEDAALFRGRARLVAGLVRRLVDAPVLVVSGPSGAGKSSVVRAGLVPALTSGALPGSGSWLPVIVTPGRSPVDALAGLTGESPPDAPVVLAPWPAIWRLAGLREH